MNERRKKATSGDVFMLSLVPVCGMMIYVMVTLYVI